jgi:hypothetical protein
MPKIRLNPGVTVSETDFSEIVLPMSPDPDFKLMDSNDTDYDVPKGYCVVDTKLKICTWIEQQPIDLWKHIDSPVRPYNPYDRGYPYLRYVVKNELFTMLALRFG